MIFDDPYLHEPGLTLAQPCILRAHNGFPGPVGPSPGSASSLDIVGAPEENPVHTGQNFCGPRIGDPVPAPDKATSSAGGMPDCAPGTIPNSSLTCNGFGAYFRLFDNISEDNAVQRLVENLSSGQQTQRIRACLSLTILSDPHREKLISACEALHDLEIDDVHIDFRPALLKNGAIRELCSCLAGPDVDVQYFSCIALRNLAELEASYEQMRADGAVSALVTQLRRTADAVQLETAAEALSLLLQDGIPAWSFLHVGVFPPSRRTRARPWAELLATEFARHPGQGGQPGEGLALCLNALKGLPSPPVAGAKTRAEAVQAAPGGLTPLQSWAALLHPLGFPPPALADGMRVWPPEGPEQEALVALQQLHRSAASTLALLAQEASAALCACGGLDTVSLQVGRWSAWTEEALIMAWVAASSAGLSAGAPSSAPGRLRAPSGGALVAGLAETAERIIRDLLATLILAAAKVPSRLPDHLAKLSVRHGAAMIRRCWALRPGQQARPPSPPASSSGAGGAAGGPDAQSVERPGELAEAALGCTFQHCPQVVMAALGWLYTLTAHRCFHGVLADQGVLVSLFQMPRRRRFARSVRRSRWCVPLTGGLGVGRRVSLSCCCVVAAVAVAQLLLSEDRDLLLRALGALRRLLTSRSVHQRLEGSARGLLLDRLPQLMADPAMPPLVQTLAADCLGAIAANVLHAPLMLGLAGRRALLGLLGHPDEGTRHRAAELAMLLTPVAQPQLPADLAAQPAAPILEQEEESPSPAPAATGAAPRVPPVAPAPIGAAGPVGPTRASGPPAPPPSLIDGGQSGGPGLPTPARPQPPPQPEWNPFDGPAPGH
ncbi:hypothetical protein PAPYR_3128 [Paratrimastix pyriformis]|uniref:Uncharacterized protein n=1 Tax=Paratrimastix pyriformis TaxID=342808 RepID=A0ABQ8UMW1_9EUKA|nr:hypothetical protein PAPYR_3128 [Paratrimastix pyriformis]